MKIEVPREKFYPVNLSQFVKEKGGLISIYDYFNLVTFLESKIMLIQSKSKIFLLNWRRKES